MASKHVFVVLPRPEPENEGRWGIYSVAEDRWLGIIYKSEMAAAEAVTELRAFYNRQRPA